MVCPFRVVLIIISALLAIGAACLALTQDTEVDEQGNEFPVRSFKQRMSEWYDETVRIWLPESLGGYKTVDVDESIQDEEVTNTNHEE